MRIAGRLNILLALAVLALVAPAGCGSSSSEETPATTSKAPSNEGAPVGTRAQACADSSLPPPGLSVSGAGCAKGRAVVSAWQADSACSSPSGASRYACTVEGLRCLGAATDRGIAVTCAGPGRSVAFVAGRG